MITIHDRSDSETIELEQAGPDNFTVKYGQQVKQNLNYAQAALELGGCIMHALTCEGRIDNRSRREIRPK